MYVYFHYCVCVSLYRCTLFVCLCNCGDWSRDLLSFEAETKRAVSSTILGLDHCFKWTPSLVGITCHKSRSFVLLYIEFSLIIWSFSARTSMNSTRGNLSPLFGSFSLNLGYNPLVCLWVKRGCKIHFSHISSQVRM